MARGALGLGTGPRFPVGRARRSSDRPRALRSRNRHRSWAAAALALIAASALRAAAPEVFVVTLTPPREGVEIRIDSTAYGITDPRGRLVVSIERGDHQVALRLGQRSETRVTGFYQSPVVIDIGATSLVEPRRDYLLRTNVPGARVHVDGVFQRATDADGRSMLELSPGRAYSIEVRKDGFVTATYSFTAGEAVNFFDIFLEKRRVPAPVPTAEPVAVPPVAAVDPSISAPGAVSNDRRDQESQAAEAEEPAANVEEEEPPGEIGDPAAAAENAGALPPDPQAAPAAIDSAGTGGIAAPGTAGNAPSQTAGRAAPAPDRGEPRPAGRPLPANLYAPLALTALAIASGIGSLVLLRRWRAARRVDHRGWIRQASRSITKERQLPDIPRYRIVDTIAKEEDCNLFLAEPIPPDGNRYVISVSEAAPQARHQDPQRIEADTGQARALVHRHIVPVHDAGLDRTSGRLYHVMPHLKATTLREYFERFAPPPEVDTLARVVLPILHALDYAHCLKPPVLHQYVRPECVMVESDETGAIKDVKLMGFGVPPRSRAAAVTDINHAAPEVRAGGRPTTASDLFAVGTILLEALGGSLDPVVSGEEGNTTNPLPKASPQVLRILAGLLAADPRERYASARDAILDCRDALFSGGGEEIGEPAPVAAHLAVH